MNELFRNIKTISEEKDSKSDVIAMDIDRISKDFLGNNGEDDERKDENQVDC